MYALVMLSLTLMSVLFNNNSLMIVSLVFYLSVLKSNWNLFNTLYGDNFLILFFKLNKVDFNLVFLLLIFVLFSVRKTYKSTTPTTLVLSALFVYTNSTITDTYLTVNSNNLEFNNLDLLLTNGSVVLHPVMLLTSYVGAIFIIHSLFLKGNSLFLFLGNPITRLRFIKFPGNLKKLLMWTFNLNLVALFLGSYWSFQELNWGGYWSWDVIELFSLTLTSIIYTLSHWTTSFSNQHLLLLPIAVLVLLLLSTRLDLLPSVHGFLSSKLNEPSISIFMVFTALSILVILVVVSNLIELKVITIKKSATWDNTRILVLALNTISFVVVTYTLLIVLVALISLNSTSDHSKVLISAIILSTVCFLSSTPSYLLFLYPTIESTILSTVLFYRNKKLPLNYQHALLAMLFYFLYNHSTYTVSLNEGSGNLYALSPMFKVSSTMTTLMGTIYNKGVPLLDSDKFNANKNNLSSVFIGDPRYLNLSNASNSSKSDIFFLIEQGVENVSYILSLLLLAFASASLKVISRKIKIRPF